MFICVVVIVVIVAKGELKNANLSPKQPKSSLDQRIQLRRKKILQHQRKQHSKNLTIRQAQRET